MHGDFGMKKRILFILRDYEHGGIPRVLANLLDCLDSERFEASLFVCNPVGIFRDSMRNCKFLKGSFLLRMLCCNYRKEHGLTKLAAIAIKLLRVFLKRSSGWELLSFAEAIVARQLPHCYDVVWACSDDVPAQIAGKIGGTKRVLWIHNNYASIFDTLSKGTFPDFLKFDKMVCVSNCAARVFKKTLLEKLGLEISSRVEALHNIVNQHEILTTSTSCPPEYNRLAVKYIFVSVGRLAWEKNYESIPRIASKLRELGIDSFQWFIVGGGSPTMRKIIEEAITCCDVQHEVILTGIKDNPYSYIRYANLLVLTSRHEAYPTVINEAKAVGTPVLSTPFEGVEEIVSQDDGWICDVDSMAERIETLIRTGDLDKPRVPYDFSEYNLQVKHGFENLVLN